MTKKRDVFLSYAHADQAAARDLRDALASLGVEVWLDESDIETFDGITESVREGIARSKAFLAFYSKRYPTRRACQWELTRAFLAAQRQGDPRQRILVVNPERSTEHIEPVELRDGLFARVLDSAGTEAAAAVAARVKERIERLSGHLGNPDPPDVPWHGRRPVAAIRFVGRIVEMWRAHSALQADEVGLISGAHGSSVAQAVGLGGIGKSLLAVEYALRYASAYSGVFWLRAHGHDDIRAVDARIAERESQLRAFAISLGASVERLSPAEVRVALAKALSALERPYLWIVDDLPSELTREEIDDWLAPTPLGKTLITTRSRAYGSFGNRIEIGLLDESDGLALLRAHRPTKGPEDTEAARELVRDLGGHALALDITGAALAAERGLRSFAQYRAALENPSSEELELASMLAGELPTGHERSITSTLLRSIRTLGENGTDFLRIASLLAVEPIPAELIFETFQVANKLDAAAALTRARAAMDEAHALSLAEIVGADDSERTVHVLVSRTVRLAASPPDRTAALRNAAVVALKARLSPVLNRQRVPQELVAHARHIAEAPADGKEVGLLLLVSLCDRERGDFHSARVTQELVLDAARNVYGEGNVNTSSAMNALGDTLAELGEKEAALELFEGALDLLRQSVGEDDPDTLTLMNNVAEARWGLKDFAGARVLHERVLAGRRRTLGAEHPQTITSMNNLAGTLADLGDLKTGQTGLEEALAARRKILGELHPDTLSTMNNLGVVLGALGDYGGARAWHRKALEGRREALGKLHPYTLTSMNNLAVTLGNLGDGETAGELHLATLKARIEVLGNRHPDTLTSLNNLASTTGQLGNFSDARTMHTKALELRSEVLGAEHPETVWSMCNLANTLEALGDFPAARDLQKRAVDILQRASGNGYPDLEKATSTLARIEARADVRP